MEGVTGLNALGVRDMNYRMVFMANNVQVNNSGKTGAVDQELDNEDESIYDLFNKMTELERNEI